MQRDEKVSLETCAEGMDYIELRQMPVQDAQHCLEDRRPQSQKPGAALRKMWVPSQPRRSQ